jgi:hypothetical protein
MNTRGIRYIFFVLGEGAILLTVAWLVLVGIAAALHVFGTMQPPANPSASQVITLVTVAVLPLAVSGWWVFRKLKPRCSRRETRAVAVSFSVVTLLSWPIAILLALIPGAYMGHFGSTLGMVGAFASIPIFVAMANFAVSSIVLWIVRRPGT